MLNVLCIVQYSWYADFLTTVSSVLIGLRLVSRAPQMAMHIGD